VRNIVARRKAQGSRRGEEERLKELKKELARVSQDNSLMAEESEKANSSCFEAQIHCQQLEQDLENARQEIRKKEAELAQATTMLEEERRTSQRLTQQIAANNRTIQ
jgi:hypothetical protein